MKKTQSIIFVVVSVVILLFLVFVLYFNRAPDRVIPDGNAIVSPANGTVIHIEDGDDDTLEFFKDENLNAVDVSGITEPYHVVVIEMNLNNVHVQRAPIAGTVMFQEHIPGGHKNALSEAYNKDLVNINERTFMVIENEDLAVGVIQVAGRAARRIRSFVIPGDALDRGEIYGRILLGSQVVLIIPENLSLDVTVGDTLIDGETIVATY